MAYSNVARSSGLNDVVKINTSGNNASPSWTTITSQKTLKFTFKNKNIDVSGKLDAGWDAFIPGQSNWSVTFDGSAILNDTGLMAIETAVKNVTPVYIEYSRSDGKAWYGNAVIASFEVSAPYDKEKTVNVTLQGDQALVNFDI
jgi:predicted secreted protein